MGLLDSVMGALGGAQGGAPGGLSALGGNAALLTAVMGMLNSDAPGGGLGGLIGKFQQGGLGDVVGSWIGSGHNLPISPEQLHNVLGSDMVAELAQKLGLSHGEVTSQLAQVLPQVVDHLTPGGEVPEGGVIGGAEALFARLGPQ